jgi:hypothetical protein
MITSTYYTNFQSCLKYGIIFLGGDNESKNIFKFKKNVIWIISGVSKCISCRQIYKDYKILTVASPYVLKVICSIKKYKGSMDLMDLHNSNMRRNYIYMYISTTQSKVRWIWESDCTTKCQFI